MAYCVKCGAKVDDSMRFCPECGAEIPVPDRKEDQEVFNPYQEYRRADENNTQQDEQRILIRRTSVLTREWEWYLT